jgi:hypothetical protein
LGERRPYKPEVAGSIPVPPTIELDGRTGSLVFVVLGKRPDTGSGRSSRPHDGIPPTIRVLLKAKRVMSLELRFTSLRNYFFFKNLTPNS